jgi:hypothetical protein
MWAGKPPKTLVYIQRVLKVAFPRHRSDYPLLSPILLSIVFALKITEQNLWGKNSVVTLLSSTASGCL